MTISRQWLSSSHVMAATDTQATMEEPLEEVFSVRSMLKLFNNQLPLPPP
jgi:hypothetical protein